ncbi:MAG: type II toxin-antitoxin system RelE/ParE family toxin [Deltaproteobacteria bacterium]|nr:type II toxin-antitoxin system RelE/ParE family toxin [Deltaproteobacteria bacterium]
MKTHWTRTAVEHLLAIYEHIAQDAPLYAQRVVDRITRRSEQIAQFPESGRIVPEYEAPDVREVIERPYRIIYRVKAERVEVLAVLHGAQRLPSTL